MQSTKTMLLGLLVMLVGFGFFVVLININLGSYVAFGPVNVLVDPFVSQSSSGSIFDNAARVASVIRVEEVIALAFIAGGMLISLAGYFRRA